MMQFTSSREKRLWVYTLIVIGGLYSSLWWAYPLSITLRDQGLISNLFWVGLIAIALVILLHGIFNRRPKQEWLLWIGILAVYLLIMLRMAVPEERSHLIEYIVLAICIHRALLERASNTAVWLPASQAWLYTTLLGIGDEVLQLWVPKRVFDPIDIFFNMLAATLAIGFSVILQWMRKRWIQS